MRFKCKSVKCTYVHYLKKSNDINRYRECLVKHKIKNNGYYYQSIKKKNKVLSTFPVTVCSLHNIKWHFARDSRNFRKVLNLALLGRLLSLLKLYTANNTSCLDIM